MDINMQSLSSNPLAKFFRQPAIYIPLPSDGKFWGEGNLDMPVNRQIPVYPMTTKDEVTLKTPDALMTGAGVVNVIQSCCPSIQNAWECPSIDLDAILIAIRIASFGHEMEIETVCPHCKESNSHVLDLRTVLQNVRTPDFSKKLEIKSFKIKLNPQNYQSSSKINIIRFEEQKILQAINSATLTPEEKTAEVNKSMNKVFAISLESLVNSTEYIELDDGTIVTQPDFLAEFYANSESEVTKLVNNKLEEIAKTSGLAPIGTTCTECAASYEFPIEFDYASFFG